MFRVMVAGHHPMASGLYQATAAILGDDIPVYVFETMPDHSPEERQARFEAMLRELLDAGEVLLLVDFLGGTPSNVVLPEMDRDGVEILTGVNMPMLFKAVTLAREKVPVGDAAIRLVEYGREHIRQIAAMLGQANS